MLEVYRFNTMSTPCEVQLYLNDKSKADICAKEVLSEVKRLESKYNYYDKASFLSLLNNREDNSLDIESKSLLQRAKQYYKKTNCIFDITMATIKSLYDQDDLKKFKEQKEFLKSYIGCDHFEIKKNRLYFDNEYTKIDLGGFVKEYAVDRSISIIKKHKIKSALVNFGGDIYALGLKPDNSKFKIGIKNPLDKEKNLFSVVLENQALTTSASYERNYTIENKSFSHILSKEEILTDILSTTIVSQSCVESGVYSTSLMIDKSIDTNNEKYLINEKLEIIR